MIILTDAEKPFDKIKHPIILRTLRKSVVFVENDKLLLKYIYVSANNLEYPKQS